MIDFTAFKHPCLAVACPSCHAAVGAWCKRPSGHKASDFHIERKGFADIEWNLAGRPPLEVLGPMTGPELVGILEDLEIKQATLARRITAEGGGPVDPGTINRYACGRRDIPPVFAAYMRLLHTTMRKDKQP